MQNPLKFCKDTLVDVPSPTNKISSNKIFPFAVTSRDSSSKVDAKVA